MLHDFMRQIITYTPPLARPALPPLLTMPSPRARPPHRIKGELKLYSQTIHNRGWEALKKNLLSRALKKKFFGTMFGTEE